MRVVHVDSAATWRGGQNQVLLTARGMAVRGHEVTLVCREGGVLAERAAAAEIRVRPLAFAGDLSPGAALGLRRALRAAPPDVVQLHDPHALAAGLLARGAARGARFVATRRVDFAVRGPLSRAKYRACDRVIAVSEAIAGVLAAGGVPRERVRVVHEGVPDRAPLPAGRDALAALGVPAGAPVVGNVAALTDHKDHATLLRAAARLAARHDTVRFVIVGEGALRAPLEAQARALGLDGRVIFAGFRDDLDRLIPAFDVFCLSSHMEGLGTSLLDAMAYSRPVVATAAGGIPEAVVHDVTGLVVPVRDAEALADALHALLRDPARREALGRAGRQRFEERFTADRMIEATLRVYDELQAGPA